MEKKPSIYTIVPEETTPFLEMIPRGPRPDWIDDKIKPYEKPKPGETEKWTIIIQKPKPCP